MWIAIAAIAAWAALMLYRMHLVGKARDHAHRERLAMIERGLVPPPEADPGQFERMTDWHPSSTLGGSVAARHRRTGITLIGVGAGLMAMLPLVGGQRAIGVSAFLIVLGITFLINAMIDRRTEKKRDLDQRPT